MKKTEKNLGKLFEKAGSTETKAVVLSRQIRLEEIPSSFSIFSYEPTGELADLYLNIKEALRGKDLSLPVTGFFFSMRADGLPVMDIRFNHRGLSFDIRDDGDDIDVLLEKVHELFCTWVLTVGVDWLDKLGLPGMSAQLGDIPRRTAAEVWSCCRVNKPVLSDSGEPDFALIAHFFASELEGRELFEGLGPCHLFYTQKDGSPYGAASNNFQLMTYPKQEGKTFFSMEARVSVITVANQSGLYLSVRPSKRNWATKPPSTYQTPNRTSAMVFAPTGAIFRVWATKNFKSNKYELDSPYFALRLRAGMSIPGSFEELTGNNPAPEGAWSQWWSGYPQQGVFYKSLENRTVYEGDEVSLFEQVRKFLGGYLEPRVLSVREIKAGGFNMGDQFERVSPSDLAVASAGRYAIDRAKSLFGHDESADIPDSASLERQKKTEAFQKRNASLVKSLYGSKRPLLWVFYQRDLDRDLLLSVANVLFGDCVEVRSSVVPPNTHGLLENLPPAIEGVKKPKASVRLAHRISAWDTGIGEVLRARGERAVFALICADDHYSSVDKNGNPRQVHEDPVNYPAGIHAFSKHGICSHHVLPLRVFKEANGNRKHNLRQSVTDFCFRAQAAMLDVVFAHAGALVNVNELVENCVTISRKNSSIAEESLPPEESPERIYGVQLTSTASDRYSQTRARSYLLLSYLDVPTGQMYMRISYLSVDKNSVVSTEWMPMRNALMWIGTNSGSVGEPFNKSDSNVRSLFGNSLKSVFEEIDSSTIKSPVVIFDHETLATLFVGTISNRAISNGEAKIGGVLLSQFSRISFVRVMGDGIVSFRDEKTQRFDSVAVQPQSGQLDLGLGSDPSYESRTETGSETYVETYYAAGQRILSLDGQARKLPQNGLVSEHFLTCIGYKATSQTMRGLSAYRPRLRMKVAADIPRAEGEDKLYRLAAVTPSKEAGIPRVMDVTVIQRPINVNCPEFLPLLVSKLRSAYAHYEDWTFLPVPLYFGNKFKDYIIPHETELTVEGASGYDDTDVEEQEVTPDELVELIEEEAATDSDGKKDAEGSEESESQEQNAVANLGAITESTSLGKAGQLKAWLIAELMFSSAYDAARQPPTSLEDDLDQLVNNLNTVFAATKSPDGKAGKQFVPHASVHTAYLIWSTFACHEDMQHPFDVVYSESGSDALYDFYKRFAGEEPLAEYVCPFFFKTSGSRATDLKLISVVTRKGGFNLRLQPPSWLVDALEFDQIPRGVRRGWKEQIKHASRERFFDKNFKGIGRTHEEVTDWLLDHLDLPRSFSLFCILDPQCTALIHGRLSKSFEAFNCTVEPIDAIKGIFSIKDESLEKYGVWANENDDTSLALLMWYCSSVMDPNAARCLLSGLSDLKGPKTKEMFYYLGMGNALLSLISFGHFICPNGSMYIQPFNRDRDFISNTSMYRKVGGFLAQFRARTDEVSGMDTGLESVSLVSSGQHDRRAETQTVACAIPEQGVESDIKKKREAGTVADVPRDGHNKQNTEEEIMEKVKSLEALLLSLASDSEDFDDVVSQVESEIESLSEKLTGMRATVADVKKSRADHLEAIRSKAAIENKMKARLTEIAAKQKVVTDGYSTCASEVALEDGSALPGLESVVVTVENSESILDEKTEGTLGELAERVEGALAQLDGLSELVSRPTPKGLVAIKKAHLEFELANAELAESCMEIFHKATETPLFVRAGGPLTPGDGDVDESCLQEDSAEEETRLEENTFTECADPVVDVSQVDEAILAEDPVVDQPAVAVSQAEPIAVEVSPIEAPVIEQARSVPRLVVVPNIDATISNSETHSNGKTQFESDSQSEALEVEVDLNEVVDQTDAKEVLDKYLPSLNTMVSRNLFGLAHAHADSVSVLVSGSPNEGIELHAALLPEIIIALKNGKCHHNFSVKPSAALRTLLSAEHLESGDYCSSQSLGLGVFAAYLNQFIFSYVDNLDILQVVSDRMQGVSGSYNLWEHLKLIVQRGVQVSTTSFFRANVGEEQALNKHIKQSREYASNFSRSDVLYTGYLHHKGTRNVHEFLFGKRGPFEEVIEAIANGAPSNEVKAAYDMVSKKLQERNHDATLEEARIAGKEFKKAVGGIRIKLVANLVAADKFFTSYIDSLWAKENGDKGGAFDSEFYKGLNSCFSALYEGIESLKIDTSLEQFYKSCALSAIDVFKNMFMLGEPSSCFDEKIQRLALPVSMDREFLPSIRTNYPVPAVETPRAVLEATMALIAEDSYFDSEGQCDSVSEMLNQALASHLEKKRFLPAFEIMERLNGSDRPVVSKEGLWKKYMQERSDFGMRLNKEHQRVVHALALNAIPSEEAEMMRSFIVNLIKSNRSDQVDGRPGIGHPEFTGPFPDFNHAKASLREHVVNPLEEHLSGAKRALLAEIENLEQDQGFNQNDVARIRKMFESITDASSAAFRSVSDAITIVKRGASFPEPRKSCSELVDDYNAFCVNWQESFGSRAALKNIVKALESGEDHKLFVSLDAEGRASALTILKAWQRVSQASSVSALKTDVGILKDLILSLDLASSDYRPVIRTGASGNRVDFMLPKDAFLIPSDADSAFFVPPSLGSQSHGATATVLTGLVSVNDISKITGFNSSEERVLFCTSRLNIEERAKACHKSPTLLIDENLIVYAAMHAADPTKAILRIGVLTYNSNPYKDHLNLPVPPEMFFGRETQREELVNGKGLTLLYGGRRLGKSSLLNEAFRAIENSPSESTKAVFADMKTDETSKFPDESWQTLYRRLAAFNLVPPLENNLPWEEYRNSMETNLPKMCGPIKSLTLLLDEAEGIMERELDPEEKNSFVKTLNRMCVNLQTQGLQINTVYAGLHNVSRMSTESNSVFGQSRSIGLGTYLDGDDLRYGVDLIEKPLHALGYYFEDKNLPYEILSICNFYPAFVQIYCEALLKRLREKRQSTPPPFAITPQDLSSVSSSEEFIRDLQEKFKLNLNLDVRYKAIALVLAIDYYDAMESSKVFYGSEESAIRSRCKQAVFAHFSGVSDETFRELLQEMVKLNILECKSRKYSLRNPDVAFMLGDHLFVIEELEALNNKKPNLRRSLSEKRVHLLVDDKQVDLMPLPTGWIKEVVYGLPALNVFAGVPKPASPKAASRDVIILCGGPQSGIRALDNLVATVADKNKKLGNYTLGKGLATMATLTANAPAGIRSFAEGLKLPANKEVGLPVVLFLRSNQWSVDHLRKIVAETQKDHMRNVQVVLIADSNQTATLVRKQFGHGRPLELSKSLGVSTADPIRIETMPIWTEDALYFALEDGMEISAQSSVVQDILDKTHGMHDLVIEIISASRDEASLARYIESFDISNLAGSADLFERFGVPAGVTSEERVRLASLACEIAGVEVGSNFADDTVIKWADFGYGSLFYLVALGFLVESSDGKWIIPGAFEDPLLEFYTLNQQQECA